MDYILGRVVFWLGASMKKKKITSPLNPCPAQGHRQTQALTVSLVPVALGEPD